MKRTKGTRSPRRSGCPLNAALETFGDRWSLLIVRDLMLFGRHAFKEFLEGGEGIATNVLAERLRRLEASGLIACSADPADKRRSVYRLTAKGIDLAPVLAELAVWALRHEPNSAPPELVRELTHHRARFVARLRREWASRQ